MADPNADAYAALEDAFNQYGLGGLVGTIQKMAQDGTPTAQVTMNLRQTPEYKQRFAANDARTKAGLPALSESDYLSMESQYRQVLRSAGMPTGFYDTQQDLQKFLANDVSPSELSARVATAQNYVSNTDPNLTAALKDRGIDQGTMVAWALDPNHSALDLTKLDASLKIGQTAHESGLGLSNTYVDQLRDSGVSQQQAQQAFTNVAQELPTQSTLAQIDKEKLSTSDLTDAALGRNNDALLASQQRAQRERARFNGNVTSTATTYASTDAGNF